MARHDPIERRITRCAIYTRKSTEHGLDAAVNSLETQRDHCTPRGGPCFESHSMVAPVSAAASFQARMPMLIRIKFELRSRRV